MEDAATAEISRSQVWQWVRHGASAQTRSGASSTTKPAARATAGRFPEARELFEQFALADDFPEFLTLPAYELLD